MLALKARSEDSIGKAEQLAIDGIDVSRTLALKSTDTLIALAQMTLHYKKSVLKLELPATDQVMDAQVDQVMDVAEPVIDKPENLPEKVDQPMEVDQKVEERLTMLVFATDSAVNLLSAEPNESLG